MAIETFTWQPDDEAQGEGTLRTRETRLGDGYVQSVGDGINGEEQPWTLQLGGTREEVAPPLAFIRRHGGFKAFLWTPPGGQVGFYRCKTFREQQRPGLLVVLSLTFERAYHP